MKIGILTFHDGINHGAFFQAYCLLKYLTLQGIDAEIINYKNRHHWAAEYRAFLITKRFARLLNNFKKIAAFRKDQKLMQLYPTKLITNSRELQRSSSRYDYIIVGSDIVWDYEYHFTGKDPAYFGANLRPRKGLISYAASIGKASGPPPDYVVQGLQLFDKISVRDENSRDLVDKFARRTATLVIDPTLLIHLEDCASAFPRSLAPNRHKKYVLIYAYYLPNSWKAKIEQFAQERGLEVVVVGYGQEINGIDETAVGPLVWLNYFKDASYIITSTFHGAIFSILCRKRFLTVATPAIENKAGGLLRALGLSEKYIYGDFQGGQLDQEPYWISVEKKLDELRLKSAQFLRSALKIER